VKDDLEPWDAETSALLEAGRELVEPAADARARVEKRLDLALSDAASAASAKDAPKRSTESRRVVYLAVAMAAGVVLGAGLHAILRPAPRGTVARGGPPVHPAPPANPVPPSTKVLGGYAALGSSDRTLLDEAAAKLMAGDAKAALAALDEHARTHPTTAFAELREALYVEALARAGRTAEARDRGSRFFASYPASLLGPAVSDALGRISDD